MCVKFYCVGAVWGRGPQPPEALGNFLKTFVICGRKAILMPFGSRFARLKSFFARLVKDHVLHHLKELNFLDLKAN